MQKEKQSVIVVGAGVAGLISARELSAAGFHVTILEARNRTGGRLHTLHPQGFSDSIESGAEFIHGVLPITIGLLKAYGILYEEVEGNIYMWKDGKLKKENEFIEHHKLLEEHLKSLQTDTTIVQFLDDHFPGDTYIDFRRSVIRFVEGYDAADPERASAFAFREAWLRDEDDTNFRIPKGYSSLADAIAIDCSRNGCAFHFNAAVQQIQWSRGNVTVETADGLKFSATKCVITIPVGVLNSENGPRFIPEPSGHLNAFKKLGYGTVIKTVFEFSIELLIDERLNSDVRKIPRKAGWMITDETIPSFWPHIEKERLFITAWVAGPAGEELSSRTDADIIDLSLHSLANIFETTVEIIKGHQVAVKCFNWKRDPYALGAYCYSTVNGNSELEILNEPVDDTLFFAGEALQNVHKGTVEAALISGLEAAAKVKMTSTDAEYNG